MDMGNIVHKPMPRREVYDTYWYIACERQNIFMRKLRGDHTLTDDPVFRKYKFCNSYRASDRVSQFLIRHVIYSSDFSKEDSILRVLLFRLINRCETWIRLENEVGTVTAQTFNFERYASAFEKLSSGEEPVYGNAFILCANKAFGYDRKYLNHLKLIESINQHSSMVGLLSSRSLGELFSALKSYPLLGNFMAYQMAIDLNYSEVFDFDENDFTCAGPGAIRGIQKAFRSVRAKDSYRIIMQMVEKQNSEFERLGLGFKDLFGRPLHAIDCQGLFCELDKYSRVRFPDLKSSRVRIKAEYKPSNRTIELFYPPKWNINDAIKETISPSRDISYE